MSLSLDPDCCEVCGAHPTDCSHSLHAKLDALARKHASDPLVARKIDDLRHDLIAKRGAF